GVADAAAFARAGLRAMAASSAILNSPQSVVRYLRRVPGGWKLLWAHVLVGEPVATSLQHALARELARAPGRGRDRPLHHRIETVAAHQHVERRRRGAARRSDVLAQCRGVERR